MLKRFGELAVRAMHYPGPASRALFWWLLRRKKRARNIFLPLQAGIDRKQYQVWIDKYDILTDDQRDLMHNKAATWPQKPLVSIILPVFHLPVKLLHETVASVQAQIYGNWELGIVNHASTTPDIKTFLDKITAADSRIKLVSCDTNNGASNALNIAMELASGEFTTLMEHGDRLAEHALHEVARELHHFPGANIIYSDEDRIGTDGQRSTPHFKPDWNQELFLATNYINHLCVFRSSLIRNVEGFRPELEDGQTSDLILRIINHNSESEIRHIPKVLYHARHYEAQPPSLDPSVISHRHAVGNYLQITEPDAKIVIGSRNQTRIIRPLPNPPPTVSLIVPTRDQVDLLKACISGLLERTDYTDLEVIIADNDSVKPQTLSYLESLSSDSRVSILKCPGPFNYSTINNQAVAKARGSIIGLINNDIEVINPGWLREMVSHAVRPEVGAVGCKLLYGDGRIQHAGVILGLSGLADHSHKYFDENDDGYFLRPHLQQYVSAVTAACLIVSKQKFQTVGGLDEKNLAVAFNDVDFCLRLTEKGWKNTYTPHATLYHHESMSRGRDRRGEKAERFRREKEFMKNHWAKQLENDPFYNPNLSRDNESFSLKE